MPQQYNAPCGFEARLGGAECELAAEWRVHDIGDKAYASVYVCPNHVGWGQRWVRDNTHGGLSAITRLPRREAANR